MKYCDSESRSCYDGSCIGIEEIPKGHLKGGEKCVRDEQCMGKSKCSQLKSTNFMRQKNVLGDLHGVQSYYNVCEETPEQTERIQKQQENQQDQR